MDFSDSAPDRPQSGTGFALFFSTLQQTEGKDMGELRLKREKVDYTDMNEHLDQQSKLYERNLHIKNSLRMQELLNAESFRKWKKLRSGGHNPPADLEPSDQFKNEHI
jgi:hypothetical protein